MSRPLKYGVSLYSYTDDFGTAMGLDEAFYHVAEAGATGIEILGETHVDSYPDPSTAWLDRWFAWVDRYKLEPTNDATWIDTRIQLSRGMTVEEGAQQLETDLRLAHRLGFAFIDGIKVPVAHLADVIEERAYDRQHAVTQRLLFSRPVRKPAAGVWRTDAVAVHSGRFRDPWSRVARRGRIDPSDAAACHT